jgi:hypothetical protein
LLAAENEKGHNFIDKLFLFSYFAQQASKWLSPIFTLLNRIVEAHGRFLRNLQALFKDSLKSHNLKSGRNIQWRRKYEKNDP